jgi:Domain of unknown function (DUF4412)
MKRIPLFIAGLCAAQGASAGVYVEIVNHDLVANTTELQQKIYVQDGNGRFVDADGRASIIKGNTMYIVDDSDKSYVVFDKATMEQLATKLNAAMEQMKDQLAKMPPEAREQMEQMMGTGAKTVDAVDTGKSDKVDGRACKLWDIKRNDELDDQICVVPYASLPGKENFQVMFQNFARVFEEMAKSVPALSGMMSSEFAAQSKVNGFPVRTRGYEGAKLGDEEQLVKVWREESIPASMFEIPAGYKVKSMSGPGAQ